MAASLGVRGEVAASLDRAACYKTFRQQLEKCRQREGREEYEAAK
jgi:hypothetical protein